MCRVTFIPWAHKRTCIEGRGSVICKRTAHCANLLFAVALRESISGQIHSQITHKGYEKISREKKLQILWVNLTDLPTSTNSDGIAY